MKFGKCLCQTLEDIPSEWKPFVIQYKLLKKRISNIVQELDDKGISQNLRKAILDAEEGYKMEFSSETSPLHIRSYIKLDSDAYSSNTLLFNSSTENTTQTGFMKHNSDSVPSLLSLPSTDSSDTESTCDDIAADNINDSIIGHQSQRSMYIELKTDEEFFDILLEEISQLNHFQQQNKNVYTDKVNNLCENLINVTSPYKKDMYTWREIFHFYLQAEIFVGCTESDRDERDLEKSQKQFKWFINGLSKMNLPRKLKSKASREAFREFLRINNDLMAIKKFQYLNKTATSKILKKHDKKTCLAARPNFEKLLNGSFFTYFTGNMNKSLCYIMNKQLSTVTPQLEDHSCPICTSIYWKPIRLCCGHVFCVRCIIKASRKGMRNCPICRSVDSVYKADSNNLDIPLQNFIKLYFPREVNTKREENGREEAGEEMEALMGGQYSSDCRIM